MSDNAKKLMGCPTTYKEEYCKEIIDFMSDGSHIHDFAAHIGVAEKTIYNWAKANQNFLQSVEVAKTKSAAEWSRRHKEKAFGVSKEGSDALLGQVLKNKVPHVYGDKVSPIDNEGEEQLDLSKCSTETLSNLAKELTKAEQ